MTTMLTARMWIYILSFGCSTASIKEETGTIDSEDTSLEEAITYDCGDETLYDPTPIGMWKVCRSKSLFNNQPTVSEDVLALLTSNLAMIETVLEPSVLAHLQTIRFWLEEDIPAFPGAVYHPSSEWLVNNGYPAYWAEGIQIGNAVNFLDWNSIQPALILHEMAHVWHHQVLGYGQVEIGNAYTAAVASGIYDSVQYAGGGMQPAYALNNKQEYFAELTEAYFWENDFYPFTRSQLETFDPQGFTALENAWVTPE